MATPPPPKKKKMSQTNCPYCNTPRVARLVTIENSNKTLCSTPSCKREIYSDSITKIPLKIKNSPQYLNEYIKSFKSIGSGLVILGSIQSTFNVRLSEIDTGDLGASDIISALTTIHRNQVYTYKVAVSYGRILSKKEEGVDEEEVKYFHASSNNSSLFSNDEHYQPYRVVSDESDFRDCVNELHDRISEDSRRPDTKWSLVGNVNANITLLRPSSGVELMGKLNTVPHFMRQHGMKHFHRNPKSKKIISDNLCFFRCLSFFLYKNTSHTEELFHRVYPDSDIKLYSGLSMNEMPLIETLFQISIQVYRLCRRKKCEKKERKVHVKFVRNSMKKNTRVMHLNLYHNHLSLIVDLKNYGELFVCKKCHKVFASHFNLKRHTNIKKECTKVNFIYKGGVYNCKKTIFQKLAEYNIHTPTELTIYPYKIVFDFECYFTETNKKNGNISSSQTQIESDHVPLSASVASDFPGYTKPVCFVREDNRVDSLLVEQVLDYINNLGISIGVTVRDRFQDVLQALDVLISEYEIRESIALKHSKLSKTKTSKIPLVNLKCELLNYIHRVPVLGFNSGRYDLNLIKREFHSFFSSRDKKEITTVKKCNQYIAVYTEHLIFLDILNYLAPGYNYSSYLTAFIGGTVKGIFPYNWMTSVRKLKCKKLPPRAAFYNSLTCQNITLAEYKMCQKVWREKKMVTFKDYLIHYNNLDVEPFVRAITAHSKFFTARNIDMFKDGLTLPGLTLKFLFQNTCTESTPYVLFSKRDQDIHNLVRKNLVGGPSIIFHRRHVSGESKIRERVYGEESEMCQHILGIDANSLYLKCMEEAHCTGFYIVRRREDEFIGKLTQNVSYSAIEWLRYRSHIDQLHILHQYNYGEVRLGGRRVPVDGFVPTHKVIYQFHGCYWHGHVCHLTKSVLKTDVGKKWLKERAEHTEQITLYLEGLGYTVLTELECRWLVLKEEPSCHSIRDTWRVKKPETKNKLSEREILDGVEMGTIFGMIQVDIYTPENLKPMFEEMTPIFKNTLVSRADVGLHMREFLERYDKLKKPQRQLIGSFHGEKILIGTPLLQWYLKKGLVVSKVYLLVEYTPEQTFKSFVKEVTDARRLGDRNLDCKILSDLYKLLGNSSYGKTICNKENFLRTRYVSQKQARKLVLHWSVQQVHDISENTVEMSCLPTTVIYDLPIQIGFMVYQYAKLKMLSFYYDFLLKFIDKKKFELCEMDTDSLYFSLSEKNLDSAVYPHMRKQYFTERHLWLPSESCDIPHHRENYIACKTNNFPWLPLPCCKNRLLFDKRTPGLFKIEWEGDRMTSLNSKSYSGEGDTVKVSCKGVIQKQNPLNLESYNNVLHTGATHMVTNKGFKVVDHHMVTYTQVKKGLNYQYIKRKICSDGVSTIPLDI